MAPDRRRLGSAGCWSGSRSRRRSFYPAVSALLHPNEVRAVAEDGHEIGIHSWIHEANTTLPREAERELTFRAAGYAGENRGREPVGIRTASWDFSVNTLDIIREMKLLYDSSLMADDDPYELVDQGEADGDCRTAARMDSRRRGVFQHAAVFGAAAVHAAVGGGGDLYGGIRWRLGRGRDVPADDASAHHRSPVSAAGAGTFDQAHQGEGRLLVRHARPGRAMVQGPRNRMIGATAWRTLSAIRARAPLVHNITDLVVTNNTANALLAIGASPAMVEGTDEVGEFARVAAALVVNLGTMNADRAAAIRLAVHAAIEAGTPWVLDPVAVGAIGYRTGLARELITCRPTAIRGNPSEIRALAGESGGGKGVDTRSGPEAALNAAQDLARQVGTTVAVTGATDYVTDGQRVIAITNGDPLMTRVTGLGCTATAILGACVAVELDAVTAAAHALAIIGVAGELAAERARGPGSLQLELLDALYLLDQATLIGRARFSTIDQTQPS